MNSTHVSYYSGKQGQLGEARKLADAGTLRIKDYINGLILSENCEFITEGFTFIDALRNGRFIEQQYSLVNVISESMLIKTALNDITLMHADGKSVDDIMRHVQETLFRQMH